MKQTTTDAPEQASPLQPRVAGATVTGLIRSPLATAGQYDHVAAAAYLMKHAGTTALMVTDVQTGRPAGVITEADITRAIAAGKDLNDVRVHAVMTTRPEADPAAQTEPGRPSSDGPQPSCCTSPRPEPQLCAPNKAGLCGG